MENVITKALVRILEEEMLLTTLTLSVNLVCQLIQLTTQQLQQ